MAGKKYGGLSEDFYTLYHVRTPKIDLAGFIRGVRRIFKRGGQGVFCSELRQVPGGVPPENF